MNSQQSLRQHIPNFITLCNLSVGFLAVLMAFENQLLFAGWLILIAALLDFLDGFLAKILDAVSEMGKQLDSLADIISFGMAPAALVYRMMEFTLKQSPGLGDLDNASIGVRILMLSPIILLLCAAIRLARFNLQKNRKGFFGLATPASGIFFAGIIIYLIKQPDATLASFLMQVPVLLSAILVISLLMILPIPMFSLKYTNFRWKGNEIRYVFLIISGILLILLQEIALPVIIVVYLLLSVSRNLIITDEK